MSKIEFSTIVTLAKSESYLLNLTFKSHSTGKLYLFMRELK